MFTSPGLSISLVVVFGASTSGCWKERVLRQKEYKREREGEGVGSKSKFIRTGVFPVAICILSADHALRAFSASSDEPARGRRVSVLFGICLYLSESCTSGRLFSRFGFSTSS
jgi:hypothetical protein